MSVEDSARPATISSVAKAAGVSPASVSRVLNGDPRVGEDIRNRVSAAIEEIDYTPNAAARSLRAQTTKQLALVVDDIGNPPYLELMRSMQRVVRESGYRLLLQSTDGRVDEEIGILRSLGQRYVDGLVMTSTRWTPEVVDLLRTVPVPIVVVGSAVDASVDTVGTDPVEGLRKVVAHLYEQGCQRLGMINGFADTRPAQSRLQGFLDGSAAHGASVAMVLHAGWDREKGREAAQRMLELEHRPDAIVCANDQLALGALDACHEQGVVVPDELALVGVDNSRDAEACHPRLTSLDLCFAERGQLAAELLLDRTRGQLKSDPRRHIIESRLVVRGSSVRGGGS